MGSHYTRRGRNWFTAMGTMFLIMTAIVLVRQLVLWGPEFVLYHTWNYAITSEKISVGMAVFGIVMITRGLLKK